MQETSPPGLTTKVTGPGGYSADASKVFEGINSRLLLATTLLVFVLLVFIYRSPIFWILPLASVFLAEGLVRGLASLLADAGVVVNGQTAGILFVLVFGAGADSRCSSWPIPGEAAHARGQARGDGDRCSQGRPAIVARPGRWWLLSSASASHRSLARPGPDRRHGRRRRSARHADGAARAAPPGGRRAFWPFIPHFGAAPAEERRGRWWRLGDWLERRHRPVWIVTALALGVVALGSLSLDDNLTTAQAFRGGVESVEGQELLERSFPAARAPPSRSS